MDKRHQDARILALGAILALTIGIITAWLFQDMSLFVMGLAVAAGFLAGAVALRARPDDQSWLVSIARWISGNQQ